MPSLPAVTEPSDRDEIERLLAAHEVNLVRFETPDLNGVSRGKTVTADHFWGFVDDGLALVGDIYCWDHECWVATGTCVWPVTTMSASAWEATSMAQAWKVQLAASSDTAERCWSS